MSYAYYADCSDCGQREYLVTIQISPSSFIALCHPCHVFYMQSGGNDQRECPASTIESVFLHNAANNSEEE